MKKLIIIFLLLSSYGLIYSQSERLMSMGNLSYIMPDKDISLNPFDIGGNPAWLYIDEKDSWLKILPAFERNRGDYKRIFDPSARNLYSLEFMGIKTLGEDGTFLGETSYEYDYRSEVPRSLRYDTYYGDPFFYNDTTSGNFRYNGPQINFMYSFEPVKGLLTGASVRYKILGGLKNIYSRSETLIREMDGNIGLMYMLNSSIAAGVNYIYKNGQEKIEAKSEDLQEVEVFNFRGDTYAVKRRDDVTDVKYTEKAHKFNAQLYYKDTFSEILLNGGFGIGARKVLKPFYFSGQSLKEFEDGYSSLSTSFAELSSRFLAAQDLYIGASAGYNRNYMWSKYSSKNLLLWEWKTKNIFGSVGFAWMPLKGLSLGTEYTYGNRNADSSKYIDNKYGDFSSADHDIKFGAEVEILDRVYARAGYNYCSLEKDLVYGGTDINIHAVTAGIGIFLSNSVEINLHFSYGFYKGLPGELKQTDYNAYSSVKLYSF